MATTRLRLHRDVETDATRAAEEIPATFRFPVIPGGGGRSGREQARRTTLVAGRVDPESAAGGPSADPDTPRPPSLRLTREDGSVTTPDLVRQVERTLDAMQARLDRLRKQAESPMRFPRSTDDDPGRPTAA